MCVFVFVFPKVVDFVFTLVGFTDNHRVPEFPIIMADYCFMQDALGSELFTILDMLDVALGIMAAISVEEKGPPTHVVSAVVDHLRAWGRKKVIFRIDCEPAIRALGVAIQHARMRRDGHRVSTKVFFAINGFWLST